MSLFIKRDDYIVVCGMLFFKRGTHSRLWNRNLRIQPVVPRQCAYPFISQPVRTNRVYFVMCVVKYLLNVIEPNNDFANQIKRLFSQYPLVNKFVMNFPSVWELEPLWR